MRLDRSVFTFYDRVAVSGVVLVGTAMALFVVLGSLGGDRTAPGLAVVVVLAAAIGWLIVKRPHRGRPIAFVVGVLALPYFANDPLRLTHPGSAVDFVPMTLAAAGTLAAAVGSGISLVEHRRGSVRVPSGAERWTFRAAVVVLFAIEVFSVSATLAGRTRAATIEGVTVLVAERSRFRPDDIEVTGDDVGVLVRNTDWVAHTFVIDELALDVYVGPRSDRMIAIPVAAAGRYRFVCTVVGHLGMDGSIEITPDVP